MREIELKESSIAAGSVAMQPRCGVPYRPELPAQSLYCPGSPCHQFLWELREDKKAGVRQLLLMFLFLHPQTRDEHSNQENCPSRWNFEEFRPYYRHYSKVSVRCKGTLRNAHTVYQFSRARQMGQSYFSRGSRQLSPHLCRCQTLCHLGYARFAIIPNLTQSNPTPSNQQCMIFTDALDSIKSTLSLSS